MRPDWQKYRYIENKLRQGYKLSTEDVQFYNYMYNVEEHMSGLDGEPYDEYEY